MCNALNLDESYRIADLVHELGVLHDEKQQATTTDARKRAAEACRRLSAKLLEIESRMESRCPRFLDSAGDKMYK